MLDTLVSAVVAGRMPIAARTLRRTTAKKC